MKKMRFEGKVCLVSGGSSGIGKATSLQLAREGGRVVIMNRDAEEGQAAVAEIRAAGGEALFIRTDVGVSADVHAAVQADAGHLGQDRCACE
jgi:NAD(P)-dependent dehydrogenase (short-subunit alcohol dehydrogenase family)